MSILRLQNVSIRYLTGNFKDIGLKEYVLKRMRNEYRVHEFWADRHISFTLEKGDMLGIIGTNGAGKSTLLKAISGIMEPTEGRVERQGSIAALLELASGFDGELTVKENAYLRGAMLGYTRQYMDESYDRIIDFAELREFQDRPFKQLSSGMKSRLAFSIASMVDPDILILDEVLSVGDGAFRKKSEAKMQEIIKGGATTILVSHSIEQIRKLCNKVLWLHKGQQIEFGEDVQGICDRYEEFLDGKRKIDVKEQEIKKSVKKQAEEGLTAKDPEMTNYNAFIKRYFALWKEQSGWKLFLFFILHYTLFFIILQCILFSPFVDAGKTFIWRLDGMPIWFTRLLYSSKTTADAISNMLEGKGWSFPLYDFNLSPARFSPGVEPITLVSALWPTDKIDTLYNILVILRFYLVGVSFSLLAFRFTKKTWAILIGALSYCFCGFSLYAGMRHPAFLSPMIMLPVLILGCEMIMNRERQVLFPLAVFLSCISGPYFAAMLGLITVLYGILRFLCLYAKTGLLKGLPVLGTLALNGIIGILLSGIILLPALPVYFDTGRIGRSVFNGEGLRQYISYTAFFIKYYQRFLGAFTVIPGHIQYWSCLGFSVLAIPTVLMLFLRLGKEERILRLSFILLTVMLCLPIVGYVMSGFTTFSNRWCFAYALCVAMIITIEAPQFVSEKSWRINMACIGSLVYAVVCVLVVKETGYRSLYGLLLMLIGLMAIRISKNHQRAVAFFCIATTVVSCCLSSVILYSPAHRNYVSEFVDTGKAYSLLDNAQYGAFADSGVEDSADGLYRVACENISRNAMSSSFYYDISGLSFNPLVNKYYLQWLNELEVADKGQNNLHYGPDGRFGILSLAGAKYYVDDCSKAFALPYGFNLATHSQQGNYENNILENEYALPIGYTYDRYLSISDYESLNAIQKQEIQLRAAALANAPASKEIEHCSLECAAKQIPVSMECDGVVIDHGTAVVEKQNATIELTFEGMPNCETYLRINGMDLTSGNSSRKWTIRAYSDEIRAEALFMSDGDQYSNGLKSQVLNLGYSEDARSNCKIVFPSKGTFLLDDLEIWCVPVTEYAEHIDTLREDVLENVETNWRGLKGTISVSSDKILCLSIPYDEGWTAYVDGKNTDLMQANTAWMAIELSAGEHEIELRYWTPGLTAGICLTVLGIIALVWYLLRRKKEKISECKMSITSDDVL